MRLFLWAAQHGGPVLFVLLMVLVVACFLVGAVVLTSIWSKDSARRVDARRTLKILLQRNLDR